MSRPHKCARSGAYYFRQSVPADLITTFGKAEVCRSPNMKNVEETKARALVEASRRRQCVSCTRLGDHGQNTNSAGPTVIFAPTRRQTVFLLRDHRLVPPRLSLRQRPVRLLPRRSKAGSATTLPTAGRRRPPTTSGKRSHVLRPGFETGTSLAPNTFGSP